MKFVVYEIWSRSRVVEAESESAAYDVADPHGNGYDDKGTMQALGLNMGNWHAVRVADETPTTEFKGGPNA
jgi:hypothetical protein